MVHFNTSNLTSNTTSKYELEEFNGVDYTTTPTKVDDTRAIKISNYLPEGNSLVKRYGYEKILSNRNNAVDGVVGITWGGRKHKVYIYGDYIIVLGEGIYKYDKNNTTHDSTHTNGLIKICNRTAYGGGIKVPDVPESGDYVFLEGDNKLYLICDGNYYVFIPKPDYDEAGFFKLCGKSGQDYDYSTQITPINDFPAVYTPTIALNYQPENSMGNSISYQQLNMLNPYFNVELFFQTTVDENGEIELATKKYDIGSLIGNLPFSLSNFDNQFSPSINTDLNGTESIVAGSVKLNGEIANENAQGYCKTTVRVIHENGSNYVSVKMDNATLTTIEGTTPEYKLKGYPFVKLILTCKITDTGFMINRTQFLKSKVGTVFGVRNSADRFFAGNTPNAPHTDWHTLDDENGNPNFTYFGTDTYNTIGSSQSEIVGYSYLNDGSLAIIKDNKDKTNIFVRTGTINTTNESYIINDTSGNKITYNYVKSVEVYPTISTGLLVKSINADTKFTLYDNKLIFNAEDGVYYLNLNATTSNQSYAVKELSYYIRDDLSNDLTNSSICTDNKYLYVARKNKNGQLRVYVANKDKYSFINGEAQYNWWVLDGIPANKLFLYNNELFFLGEDLGLYKFKTNDFSDYNYITAYSAYIGSSVIPTDVAFDGSSDKMIVATNSTTWQSLLDIYKYNANINKDSIMEKLNFIKNNVSLKASTSISSSKNLYLMSFISNYGSSINPLGINFSVNIDKVQSYVDIIDYIKENELELYNNAATYKVDEYNVIYNEDNAIFNLELTMTSNEQRNFVGLICLLLNNQQLKVKELFTSDGKALSDYFYVPETGWINATTGDFVSQNLNFNMVSFTFMGFDVNFLASTIVGLNVTFIINAPVQSYWYGKFTDLGAIDTLKTTKSIHFIPETRRGGFTEVGYRTRKTRQFTTNTSDILTPNQYRVELIKNRNYETNDLGINLNNIDFNNFSFESDAFARTYSSKKKIKNFAFIQLKFESTKEEDSTITSLAIKYIYTKNNKGVK